MAEVKKEKKDKSDKAEKREKSEKKEKKDKSSSSKHHHHRDEVAAPASPASPTASSQGGEEEDWDANRNLIEAICKTPPNNMCNDCNQPGTRWASVNHGVFVCIRCSGIHRSLGVHISKVKSTNMDKWTTAEIKLMELIGNRRAKDLYEARLPKGFKPLAGQEAESVIRNFIVKKYDEKLFSTEGILEIMKKMYKQSGYGRKGGAKVSSSAKTTAAGAVSTASHEDPMKSLYGASSSLGDKKKKKDAAKVVEGAFGTITMPIEEHDAMRAAVLAHFGVVVEEAVAAAAAAPAEAVVEASA